MKVLDLQCRLGHVFEGWFGSEDDFQRQKQRGLMQCPLCADDHIEKRLSAPRLLLGTRGEPAGGVTEPDSVVTSAYDSADAFPDPQVLQSAWLKLARKIAANTEDVGQHFADEARRMHRGEVSERAIRGQSTRAEAAQLLEEGISVMPVPIALPIAAKETLQ